MVQEPALLYCKCIVLDLLDVDLYNGFLESPSMEEVNMIQPLKTAYHVLINDLICIVLLR
jgi:hypothetical protein